MLIFLSISCQKKKYTLETNLKQTTSEFINFNNYDFNTVTGTKEKILLTDNKKYVLDFWYLECAPCVKQHKEIGDYQERLIKNNIEVIGISIDMSQENWKKYLQEHHYNWRNYNQYFEENVLKDDLDIQLFPRYYIIDAKGNIQSTFNSFQKVIKYLNL